jgi:hypothetical protein
MFANAEVGTRNDSFGWVDDDFTPRDDAVKSAGDGRLVPDQRFT